MFTRMNMAQQKVFRRAIWCKFINGDSRVFSDAAIKGTHVCLLMVIS